MLAECVTVGWTLIFYGKFQDYISGYVQIFKHLFYHHSPISREIHFTGEKTSAHMSIKTHYFASEREQGENMGKEDFILLQPSRESPGLHCNWTFIYHSFTIHWGNGCALCFSQSGPTPEAMGCNTPTNEG